MSAEIILMNKDGVALAADSAMTIVGSAGISNKIYDCCDKMFMLSKCHPIGAMIYNRTDFMGIPLEILIKDFRAQLGRAWPADIGEVKDKFTEFLKKDKANYDRKIFMSQHLVAGLGIADGLLKNLKERVEAENGCPSTPAELCARAGEELPKLYEAFIGEIELGYEPCFRGDIEKMKKDILEKYAGHIDFLITDMFATNTLAEFYPSAREPILDICSDWFFRDLKYNDDYAGIVIAGYGKDKLYPSCIHFKLYGEYEGTMLITEEITFDIGNDDNHLHYLKAFAQDDVVKVFIDGIDDRCYSVVQDEIESFAPGGAAGLDGEARKALMRRIAIALDRHSRANRQLFEVSISAMPKKELAMTAENLVNITSFKRRVAYDILSGTVGGPTDVAVISRGDGFVWIKRKSYFDETNNHHYVAKYYRGEESREDGNDGR